MEQSRARVRRQLAPEAKSATLPETEAGLVEALRGGIHVSALFRGLEFALGLAQFLWSRTEHR